MTFFRDIGKSFRHALRGLFLAFRSERSFRIQTVAAFFVLFLCLLLPFQPWERVVLLFATASVLVLELLNTMIERLTDLVKPRLHSYVHDIKDLMAATVLLASVFAVLFGIVLFGPYLRLLSQRV